MLTSSNPIKKLWTTSLSQQFYEAQKVRKKGKKTRKKKLNPKRFFATLSTGSSACTARSRSARQSFLGHAPFRRLPGESETGSVSVGFFSVFLLHFLGGPSSSIMFYTESEVMFGAFSVVRLVSVVFGILVFCQIGVYRSVAAGLFSDGFHDFSSALSFKLRYFVFFACSSKISVLSQQILWWLWSDFPTLLVWCLMLRRAPGWLGCQTDEAPP